MITLQDIFTAAWKAFIIEGKPPAMDENGCCSYLIPGIVPKRCAIGLSLPLDTNGPEWGRLMGKSLERVGATFAVLVRETALFDESVKKHTDNALVAFQHSLHDEHVNKENYTWNVSPEVLRDAYVQVAHDFNLMIPGDDMNYAGLADFLKKEEFVQWLKKQPLDRQFSLGVVCTTCPIAMYGKEGLGFTSFGAGATTVDNGKDWWYAPTWVIDFIARFDGMRDDTVACLEALDEKETY